MTLLSAWRWLRSAASWLGRHGWALLAGVGILAGALWAVLRRRDAAREANRAHDVGVATGRAEILDAEATTHAARADAARDEDARLRDLQDRAEVAAAQAADEIRAMTPDEKVALGESLIAARRRRQMERGR